FARARVTTGFWFAVNDSAHTSTRAHGNLVALSSRSSLLRVPEGLRTTPAENGSHAQPAPRLQGLLQAPHVISSMSAQKKSPGPQPRARSRYGWGGSVPRNHRTAPVEQPAQLGLDRVRVRLDRPSAVRI